MFWDQTSTLNFLFSQHYRFHVLERTLNDHLDQQFPILDAHENGSLKTEVPEHHSHLLKQNPKGEEEDRGRGTPGDQDFFSLKPL